MVDEASLGERPDSKITHLAELTADVPHPLLIAARILTGSTYALLGFDAVRAPGARVDQAASTLSTLRSIMPLPNDDELLVRSNAAVQGLAGTLLALGRAQVSPR